LDRGLHSGRLERTESILSLLKCQQCVDHWIIPLALSSAYVTAVGLYTVQAVNPWPHSVPLCNANTLLPILLRLLASVLTTCTPEAGVLMRRHCEVLMTPLHRLTVLMVTAIVDDSLAAVKASFWQLYASNTRSHFLAGVSCSQFSVHYSVFY